MKSLRKSIIAMRTVLAWAERCSKPGIRREEERGLYGKFGLIQLAVANDQFLG